MANLPLTYAVNSVTHGAVVWNNSDGGPIRVVVTPNANVVRANVAGDYYDSDVAVTREETEILVDLSEFEPTSTPTVGAEDELVLSLKESDGTSTTVTLYRCKYVGLTNMEQTRDSVSASAARFVYNAGGTEKDIFTT